MSVAIKLMKIDRLYMRCGNRLQFKQNLYYDIKYVKMLKMCDICNYDICIFIYEDYISADFNLNFFYPRHMCSYFDKQ